MVLKVATLALVKGDTSDSMSSRSLSQPEVFVIMAICILDLQFLYVPKVPLNFSKSFGIFLSRSHLSSAQGPLGMG